MVNLPTGSLPELGAILVVPVTDAEYEFTFQVKKAGEGELITRVFGWDEALQRDYHRREWVERRPSLITVDGRPVGTVVVQEEDGHLKLARFFILPEFENRGIGSEILRGLVRLADERQLTTRLALLAGNRCENLYRRHGFAVVHEEEALRHMERGPRPPVPEGFTPSDIVLRLPRLDEENEVLYAHRATSSDYPSFLHCYEDGVPFEHYLDRLTKLSTGQGSSAYGAPATFLFAFAGPRIVGRVSIRHGLNERMALVGGHIGYVVVPEFRRQGYATAILRWALGFARDTVGLRRVLVTCDETNGGSIRTIEKCGGVFEGLASAPDLAVPKRRYWIETGNGGRG